MPRLFRRERLPDRSRVFHAGGVLELCTFFCEKVISPVTDLVGVSDDPYMNQSSRPGMTRVDAPAPSCLKRCRRDLTSTPAMPESCGRCLEDKEAIGSAVFFSQTKTKKYCRAGL